MTPLGCPDCLLIRYELRSSTERFAPPLPPTPFYFSTAFALSFSLYFHLRAPSRSPLAEIRPGSRSRAEVATPSPLLPPLLPSRTELFSPRLLVLLLLPPFYIALFLAAPSSPRPAPHLRRRLFLPLLFLKCASFLLLNLHTLSLRF